jgi:hypothetical protein
MAIATITMDIPKPNHDTVLSPSSQCRVPSRSESSQLLGDVEIPCWSLPTTRRGLIYNLKLTYLEMVYAKVFIWNRLLTTSGSAVVMSIVMILLPPTAVGSDKRSRSKLTREHHHLRCTAHRVVVLQYIRYDSIISFHFNNQVSMIPIFRGQCES